MLFSASVALSTYVASLQSEGDGNLFTNTINITSAIVSFALFFRSFILFLNSALHSQDPHPQMEKGIDYLIENISSFSDEHLDALYEIVKTELGFFDGSRKRLLPCPGIP